MRQDVEDDAHKDLVDWISPRAIARYTRKELGMCAQAEMA